MKLKMLLFTGCMLLLSGLANAQFNAELFYNEACDQPGLSELCGFSGDVLPDGTNIEIFWDANSNGPDSLDQQPVVGFGFGQCNFNTFPMNGAEINGCAGGFYSMENFTIPTNTPQPSRYWLRVCVPGQSRYWQTNVFIIPDGYSAQSMTGRWSCVEEACGGCIAPPDVAGFSASENSCTSVTFSWTPYVDPDVDSLLIYRSALDTLIAKVGKTQTPFVYNSAPVGEYSYQIRARKISAGDTCYSNISSNNGTRFPSAVAPASCLATDDRCGNVIVSWTNPNNVTTVDSFKIFRNGVEVGNQVPGILGQPNSDTISLGTGATGFFTVRGWNIECGLGATATGDSGRAAIAPATPTVVSATVGECAVTIRWNRVTGATAYRVMRDGVTNIGTPVDTFLVHEPPSPQTPNAYTVIAINEPNPTACEESAASLPANGSDIDPPNAPTSPSASDSTSCAHVVVSWTDNSTNELGFIIQRGGVSIDTADANATSFNDTTAAPGTLYTYAVASYNQCGPSSFISAGSGSRKQVPTTPGSCSATDNLPTHVRITWNAIIRETNMKVLRNGTQIALLPADSVGYNDSTAVPGTMYGYSVRGTNDCGDGAVSNVDSGRVLASLNPPTNVQASDTNCTFVRVTWTDTQNETGYEVLRNGTPISGTLAANTVTYDDNTAALDSVYAYSVRALGPGGPATSTSDNGRRAPLPGTPTVVLDSVTCTEVIFSWTAGSNSDTVLIYQDGTQIYALPGNPGSFTTATLADDQFHSFYLISANECGRGDTSDVLTVRRDQVPGTVSDLAGTSTDCNSVSLTWTSPPDADNLDVYANGVFQGSFAAWLTGTSITTGNGPANWEFYLIPQNECGAGDTSNVINVAVSQSPTVPTNVAASDTSCDFVYITWSASSGDVDGYTILEDGFNIGSVLPGTLSFQHDPGNSTVHEYRVYAYSETCANSAPSALDQGNKVEQPGQPVNLLTDGNSCDSIRVMWDAASGSPLGYVIFLDSDSIAFTTDLHYAFVPVSGPGTYNVGVASYSAFCGTGTPVYHSYQLFPQPVPVSNFVASTGRCDGVQLTWDAYTGIHDGLLIYRNGSQIATAPSGSTSFFDAGAPLGSTRYAVITLSNLTGCAESDSATANGAVLPLPTAPTNVAASDTSCSNVHITWSAATGTFTGYTIWRDTDSIGFVAAGILEFTDTGILPGATEAYAVSAFDVLCGQSPLSTSDNGTRLLGPNPPSGVAATDDDCNVVTVTWLAAAGDVTEYRIYRDGVLAGQVNASTFTFADSPAAGTYAYTVTAFSTNCGETGPSIADNGTRLPTMGQLQMVSASVDSCGGILVTWAAYPGATSYRIYREGNPGVLAEINAPTTTYFDSGVLEGEVHSYFGTAVNVCNEGATSNVVIGQRAQTPDQVLNLTATDNVINEICLSWDDVDGELAYNIYRDGSFLFANSADDTSYCDNSAVPGQVYVYTVGATNVCGVGAVSDTAAGVAVFSLAQVQNLLATTDNCNEVCMSWTDIENETGYIILRAAQPYDTVDANVTTYCDTGVLPGQCYSYTVRGFNVGGAGQPSAPSVGCRRDIPTQVTGLSATTTNCSVVILTWTDATNEDAYDVYRDGVIRATGLAANTITYTDNSATPGVPYQYTVVARNACGSAAASAAAQGVVAMVPPAVAGVVASVDVCNQIGLNWTDQLSELGYRIYRDGNFGAPIATVGANVTVYIDANITGSHTYNVRAYNDCGNGDLSAAVTGIGLTVPGVATNVAAAENCGDVTITWTLPATQPITESRVFRNGVQINTVPFPTATYVDENLPAGTYSYRIVMANQCGTGTQSNLSNSVTVIPALAQVTGFAATPSSCFCINLSWSNLANETGFYVYCDGVIVDSVNANITSMQYCPADTQSCLLQVAAYNGCEIGPLSAGISVTPNTYPVAVANFTASENFCDRVRLQWTPYSAQGVNWFRISRNDVTLAVIPSSATSYDHLGVWPQSTYQIRALRVCSPGDTISMLSADAGRTAPTPVAPVSMSASDNACGVVNVTFTFANIDGQDSVYIKRNGNIYDRLGPSLANVERIWTDTNPLPAPATYMVCAKSNICGEGGCASDFGQAAPTAGTVTNVEASHEFCTTIVVDWTGTTFATGYIVRRGTTVLDTVEQGTFTFTDNVATGSVFNYTVTAYNACGNGPTSTPANGSTIPVPPAPTGVAASDGLCNEVIVTWNDVAVATSYEIYRNNGMIGTSPDGVLFFVDNTAQPGVTYNYQVRGVNQCGLGALSTPPTPGFAAATIAQVTNLTASTTLDDRVHLAWNNVQQETGYEILRGFPAQVIDTVGIDVTSYEDFSAAPGEEYEYRVRAFNGCGTGPASVVAYGYRVPVDPIVFGVATVTETLFGCMSAEVFDGDNDGDPDVIATGMFADQIVAYENNGSWGFTPHVIVENWDGARSIDVADIDGDGDDDAAAVAQFADRLIWIQGNGTLNPVVHTIATNYDGARDVVIEDVDGDNDMDLVTAACDANDVSWWRNNGNEVFTRFVIDNNFVDARSVEVVDLDGDGDMDILGAAFEGGMFAKYINNGSEVFTRTVLADDMDGASYINAARLNTDNVLDIYFCVAQEPLVAWWDGATHELNYVTSLIPFPREMDAMDMDDDDRADLLLAANENQEISWWRNTDNRFYRNVLTSTLTQASVVHAGDYDNDGDVDVLGAGEGTIKFWLSSLSDNTEGTELLIPTPDDGGDKPALGHTIVPLNYELGANYPNPFNPLTQIQFGLPESQSVKLIVYDITGREVARLADGYFAAGYHTVSFDASTLASGLYLYRIEAGSFVASRKMVLMK